MFVLVQVFQSGKVVFFVASRGHHAEIGGITPGRCGCSPYNAQLGSVHCPSLKLFAHSIKIGHFELFGGKSFSEPSSEEKPSCASKSMSRRVDWSNVIKCAIKYTQEPKDYE